MELGVWVDESFLGYAEICERSSADLVCFKRRRRKRLWESVPLGVFWTIWKERNGRVFEDEERSIQLLKNSLPRSLLFWCIRSGVHDVKTLIVILLRL